jgi:hypothetical protein
MKKILIVTAVFLFILLIAEMANQVPPPARAGYDFWLYAQQVVECSATEITLLDKHQTEIHLDKDESSWPACASFHKDDVLDFHLSRGAKTHYLRDEPTAWWRKVM